MSEVKFERLTEVDVSWQMTRHAIWNRVLKYNAELDRMAGDRDAWKRLVEIHDEMDKAYKDINVGWGRALAAEEKLIRAELKLKEKL